MIHIQRGGLVCKYTSNGLGAGMCITGVEFFWTFVYNRTPSFASLGVRITRRKRRKGGKEEVWCRRFLGVYITYLKSLNELWFLILFYSLLLVERGARVGKSAK